MRAYTAAHSHKRTYRHEGWVRSGPNAVPKNGLLFEVDRTSSLLTSANHPKAVVYLRGAERRCLA